MPTSYKVQFWEHRVRNDRRKPFMVRWTVGSREFSESFLTKTQADGRRPNSSPPPAPVRPSTSTAACRSPNSARRSRSPGTN